MDDDLSDAFVTSLAPDYYMQLPSPVAKNYCTTDEIRNLEYKQEELNRLVKSRWEKAVQKLEEQKLRELTLRTLTKESKNMKERNKTVINPKLTVPGLFSLSENPYSIIDIRTNPRNTKGQIVRGMTLPYVILKMAANQYERNARSGILPQRVELSYQDIINMLKDNNYCAHPIKGEIALLPGSHLNRLLYEVKRKIGFTENEVKTELINNVVRLIFIIPKVGSRS